MTKNKIKVIKQSRPLYLHDNTFALLDKMYLPSSVNWSQFTELVIINTLGGSLMDEWPDPQKEHYKNILQQLKSKAQ